MTKFFYCQQCDWQGRELDAPVMIMAYIYLNGKGEPASEWEGDLPLNQVQPLKLNCPVCGSPVQIAERECKHEHWSALYQDPDLFDGKSIQRCQDCGLMRLA